MTLSRKIAAAVDELTAPLEAPHEVTVEEVSPVTTWVRVADMLELSLPAVKSRLHRARLMMRDALSRHFEERLS